MTRLAQSTEPERPNVLIVGVHAPYNPTKNIQSYYEEFVNLVKANDVRFQDELFIKLREIDSTFFLTKGKLEQVREVCEKHDIEQLIVSEPLTAQQERNLSDYLGCAVFDRTRLILDIFERAAQSAEGKTQVEIARLQFQKSRLAGKGIHLSQQAGAIGVRGGPGETLKEKATRYINENILKLKKQLKRVEKSREVQRKRRLSSALPLVSLVGYTNAGKSTILNALTKSDVLAQDKPFATLDTTTRELYIRHEKGALISDTVGFIQQLPPQLIEAFKSTLSELTYANLLLHVVDASDPNWEHHTRIVNTILEELGVTADMLYVFNKMDRVDDRVNFEIESKSYAPAVYTDARSRDGLEPLIDYLAYWCANRKES